MHRTHQALITLALGLALVTATTAAGATPPTGTQDPADQRRPLYQPQPDRSLRQRARAPSPPNRSRSAPWHGTAPWAPSPPNPPPGPTRPHPAPT